MLVAVESVAVDRLLLGCGSVAGGFVVAANEWLLVRVCPFLAGFYIYLNWQFFLVFT